MGRVVQLLRIAIGAHILFGAVMIIGGRAIPAEAAATLYGATLSGSLALWAWPLALALWNQPALEALRRARGGVVEHASWFLTAPALRFRDEGLEGRIELSVASCSPTAPVLLLKAHLTASEAMPGRCRLAVRRGRGVAGSLAATPLGDPEFDGRLTFATGSHVQAEALIRAGIRAPLLEIFQLSSNLDELEIVYDGRRLVVARSLAMRWQEDWPGWALKLMDRNLRLLFEVLRSVEPELAREDVETVELEPAMLESGADTLCLVCAGNMTHGRAAICLGCETPHHLECWSYNGQCALFGCGSTLCREQVISVSGRREALDS
jgi:hypothetical protein